MINDDLTVQAVAWGRYALFSDPNIPTERVSLPIMTPCAARGVLGAIYAHPDMEWRILDITALKPFWQRHGRDVAHKHPVNTMMITRNEIKEKVLVSNCTTPIDVGDMRSNGGRDMRAQRSVMVLRDVAYLIRASVRRKFTTTNTAKCVASFSRRLKNGQFYHKPYFGCREFGCYMREPDGTEQPWDDWNLDLGWMIHEIHWPDCRDISCFRAQIKKGVLDCTSTRVIRGGRK